MSSLALRSAGPLVASAGLALLVGCAPSYGRHHRHVYYGHHHHHHDVTGTAVAVGVVAGLAIAAAASPPEPPPPTAVYVYTAPPPPIVVAAPPPPAPPRADDLPPLDPAATRAAFSSVDLAGCNAPPQIYGHARISLNPDGRVSRVVVEDPPNLAPDVARCIGDRIGQITVRPFRGGMVVLGTTFRVR